VNEKDQPERDAAPPRSTRRRLLFGNLAKIARPPLTTPQWKDAVREQEARAEKKPPRDD
jgi:hypothetical protein